MQNQSDRTMEQRLIDIELKLVSLEDTVQSLNELVYEQGRQIDEMRALCRMLMSRMEDASGPLSNSLPADERPPHY